MTIGEFIDINLRSLQKSGQKQLGKTILTSGSWVLINDDQTDETLYNFNSDNSLKIFINGVGKGKFTYNFLVDTDNLTIYDVNSETEILYEIAQIEGIFLILRQSFNNTYYVFGNKTKFKDYNKKLAALYFQERVNIQKERNSPAASNRVIEVPSYEDVESNITNTAYHNFINGNYEKALINYEKLLTIHPGNEGIEWNIALCEAHLNRGNDSYNRIRRINRFIEEDCLEIISVLYNHSDFLNASSVVIDSYLKYNDINSISQLSKKSPTQFSAVLNLLFSNQRFDDVIKILLRLERENAITYYNGLHDTTHKITGQFKQANNLPIYFILWDKLTALKSIDNDSDVKKMLGELSGLTEGLHGHSLNYYINQGSELVKKRQLELFNRHKNTPNEPKSNEVFEVLKETGYSSSEFETILKRKSNKSKLRYSLIILVVVLVILAALFFDRQLSGNEPPKIKTPTEVTTIDPDIVDVTEIDETKQVNTDKVEIENTNDETDVQSQDTTPQNDIISEPPQPENLEYKELCKSTILEFTKATNDRDMGLLLSYFADDIDRYWKMYNPSKTNIKNEIERIWGISPYSRDRNIKLNEHNSLPNTYIMETTFEYMVKDGTLKEVESKVLFKFDNYGKIKATYGI